MEETDKSYALNKSPKSLLYHTNLFLAPCFVSQYNAFSASDLKCGLLFGGKLFMYVVTTLEY